MAAGAVRRSSPGLARLARLLGWLELILFGLAVASIAISAQNILAGDAFALRSLRSFAKVSAWFFGQCLWCTGRETTGGILANLAGGFGYLLGVFSPLVFGLGLGILRRAVELRASALDRAAGTPWPAVWLRPSFLAPALAAAGSLVLALSAVYSSSRPASSPARPSSAEAFLDSPSGTSLFVVQVGVFENEEEANRVQAMLERVGLRPFATAPQGGKVRVRLGPYPSRDDALTAAQAVRRLELPAAVLDVSR
ncbi:SPOR domain-containing protein [Variovorax sp. WDL1]|uniref:SPOR domain-containing protein n=1 Tax=Variovorax sp. WDL1 TaxID=207745 RepID=UPI0008388D56|nr:SPOR domain-containing protein [Variovorax sp. WDL1]